MMDSTADAALPTDHSSNASAKRVAVLGSTGSIGCNALEVIAANPHRYQVFALSGHAQVELLSRQCLQFRPQFVVATNQQAASRFPRDGLTTQTQLLTGSDALQTVAAHPEADVVLAGIVGVAGLRSTWAALEAGKLVALANKESLVVAGPLMMDLVRTHRGRLIPVDSEHSAVFQALQAGRAEEVKRVVLTASGGPFRRHTKEQLQTVSVADALAHPTWEMGPKITVDSATMMNKALEIIEARWLFDLRPEQISVVVHPQSIVHSFVEFADSSVMAQLSPPDMKLPIQYALSYPDRHPGPMTPVDWRQVWSLEFEPPDFDRFPALQLGLDVAAAGGTAGAVVNAANEAAVGEFLSGRLPFTSIVPACRTVLKHHTFDPTPSLEDLLAADRWARTEVLRCT